QPLNRPNLVMWLLTPHWRALGDFYRTLWLVEHDLLGGWLVGGGAHPRGRGDVVHQVAEPKAPSGGRRRIGVGLLLEEGEPPERRFITGEHQLIGCGLGHQGDRQYARTRLVPSAGR